LIAWGVVGYESDITAPEVMRIHEEIKKRKVDELYLQRAVLYSDKDELKKAIKQWQHQ